MASHLQRAHLRRHDSVTARAAFRLATLGGAEALRLDDAVGSLEVGKQADLVVFACPPDGGIVSDPYAALVFGASPQVRRVLVAGVERVRDGVVHGWNASCLDRVQDAALRLERWRSTRAAR